MSARSAHDQMIQYFAGTQRLGIGRFSADPSSGRWTWTDPIYDVFGYPPGSVDVTWDLIVGHIPDDERQAIQAAYEQACTRLGPFSWSHCIQARDGKVRSILIVAETTAQEGPDGASSEPAPYQAFPTGLAIDGYVIDLTELRADGARAAATEAVQSSAAHRAVIEQAKGALMLGYGIDADAAFALLVCHSQQSNRKLHAVAAQLVVSLREPLATRALRESLDSILERDGSHDPAGRDGSTELSSSVDRPTAAPQTSAG
jgi:hypothetical protein